MDDLVNWLRVQLDEDERTARATTWDGSGNRLSWELIASATIDVGGDEFYVGDRTIANHMMAWEPARVLREVDAKRRIIDEHTTSEASEFEGKTDTVTYCPICRNDGDCPTLRLLALTYADRPGYQDSWRP